MKVTEIMTRDIRVIAPDRTVRDAARIMDEMNVGVLPVCNGDELVGMITDRDITVRSTAAGVAPDRQQVGEVMSRSVQWCRSEDDANSVLEHMSAKQIRRMPVLDAGRHVVGIIALGDLATADPDGAQRVLRDVSTPSEPDRSGMLTTQRADQTRSQAASPLTAEEEQELARRHAANADARESQTASSPIARGGSGARDAYRFREEDDVRASFAGGFNQASSDSGTGNRMPGGYGGDGYNNYGATYSEGGQGGGAGGPSYFGDHGSNPDGTPRRYGTEGEENFDRDIRVEGPAGATGQGSAQFSNETTGYQNEGGGHADGTGSR